MRKKIRRLLDDQTSLSGRLVGLFIILLIMLSCAAVMCETVPTISQRTKLWLDRFEIFSITVFTIEYLLRLWSAKSWKKKLVQPLMIVDLLSILPFFLGLIFPYFIDMRFLRVLRTLRILRILKMNRYSRALSLLVLVVHQARHQLLSFLFVVALCLILTASFIYNVEPERFSSIPDAIWWAVVTLTTVGYGDIVPGTPAGKIASGFIMLLGIGIIAIPTGIIASGMTEYYDKVNSRSCSSCGTQLHETDAKYCKICGYKLTEDTERYSVLGTQADQSEFDVTEFADSSSEP